MRDILRRYRARFDEELSNDAVYVIAALITGAMMPLIVQSALDTKNLFIGLGVLVGWLAFVGVKIAPILLRSLERNPLANTAFWFIAPGSILSLPVSDSLGLVTAGQFGAMVYCLALMGAASYGLGYAFLKWKNRARVS